MAENPKIIIVVEGGIVQAVVSHDIAMCGLTAVVVDYDCEGGEGTAIRQSDGMIAEANVYAETIESAEIEILGRYEVGDDD